jgi:hypothetical protein
MHMVIDCRAKILEIAPRHLVRVVSRIISAQGAVDVRQVLVAEKFAETPNAPNGFLRPRDVWHHIPRIKRKHVCHWHLSCRTRPSAKRRYVPVVDVVRERVVGLDNVVSTASSADLATSIEDDPGCEVGKAPTFVPPFRAKPESRRS